MLVQLHHSQGEGVTAIDGARVEGSSDRVLGSWCHDLKYLCLVQRRVQKSLQLS